MKKLSVTVMLALVLMTTLMAGAAWANCPVPVSYIGNNITQGGNCDSPASLLNGYCNNLPQANQCTQTGAECGLQNTAGCNANAGGLINPANCNPINNVNIAQLLNCF